MTYRTSKNYFKNRLEGLGFKESKQPFDFEQASEREYNNRFIIFPSEGESDPDGEQLNSRLYDNQIWNILIAFSKAEHSDVINRDLMFTKIETIIKDLDNPTNYESILQRPIHYDTWEVEESENYYQLTIKFRVQDQYNY